MKKEIMDSPWDFTLYEENNKKILDVVYCNSFVDYSRKFVLKGEELDYDFEQIKALAEDIRNNYDNYKDREVTE